MEALESIKTRIEKVVGEGTVEVIENPSPSRQHSLLATPGVAVEVATFLRDDPELRLDYLSNVTGIDWLDRTEKLKKTVTEEVDGETKEVTKREEVSIPGYLEVVYHLYSMVLKQGPLVLRMRTENRTDRTAAPSLTPVWRSAELQEREVYDLYGVHFEGHPDLRRLLMWDAFEDHPMRKDYVDPDDYEYEPTPHGEVLERAKCHHPGAGEELA